ncbi:MAG: hypothetical protein QOI08_3941, partial [Actinomycetota bacterium]|nr:hypothetical protein [Actinomycetota bacterium]
MPATDNLVELERGAAVARLVLNRPDRRNALSQSMMDEMLHALDTVAADEAVRVLVIEGRGPAFSAGHDLAE